MKLTIHEYDLIHSITTRIVNMTKRFLPEIADFDRLIKLIRELHNIHALERKIVMSRVNQVNEAKDFSDESHCNPSRFFQYKSVFGEFKQFWREFNTGIYTKKMKEELAAAYFANEHLKRIEVGYHINRTGNERGTDLLALFNTSSTATRITFADGTTLDIPSLEESDMLQARTAYEKKVEPQMIPVPAYPKWN